MAHSKKITHDKISMNVMDAIYNRRAVRDYLTTTINQDLVHTLLNAAIQSLTAMHEEPWSHRNDCYGADHHRLASWQNFSISAKAS